jgi:hypothetical protein
MSLITDIATLVNTLYPSATFILSSKFNANLASFSLTETQLPLIILDNELSKDSTIHKNANVQKDSRIVISVLDLDSAENSDLQSESIRQECEDIADRLAINILRLSEVIPLSNQKYKTTPAFHVFSTNLTGVILDMRANENVVINFCTE